MVSPPPVDQLVVLAHPDPNSFCASIVRRWQECAHRNGQTCGVRDLYRDEFDPVLKANEQPGKAGYTPIAEICAERQRLERLNVLVFVYPVWFGTPPAMLKGYLERVVGSGISVAAGAQSTKPLANVRLVQISTSASSGAWLNEQGIPSALHTIFDRYSAEVFGAQSTDRLHLDLVVEGMGQDRGAMRLAEVEQLADRVCADANAERWSRARAGI